MLEIFLCEIIALCVYLVFGHFGFTGLPMTILFIASIALAVVFVLFLVLSIIKFFVKD